MPVVVVPGVTGTRLEDTRTGRQLWGVGRRLFLPRDRGREVALPLASSEPEDDPVQATTVLFKMRILGIRKEVYRPLARALERAGHRRGDPLQPSTEGTLYFFAYDWRYDNQVAVGYLDLLLRRIAVARSDQRVSLICQSNAGRICRYLAKYGGLSLKEAEGGALPERGYRVGRLLLVGTSNGGSLRQLHELDRGRRYVRWVGRKSLEIDLYDPQSWHRYGWSVFSPRIAKRLERKGLSALFASPEERLEYLATQLRRSRRLQLLLAADAAGFDDTRYYLLENGGAATPTRAVLHRRKGRWRSSFYRDRFVKRKKQLHDAVASPGDGHATLSSQRSLSPQERDAVAARLEVSGAHFGTILRAATHHQILVALGETSETHQP